MTRTLYAFRFSSLRASFLTYFIPFDLLILKIPVKNTNYEATHYAVVPIFSSS
jgi:hypothetical protein